jgi:cobalt-zinc-cadmium efflux system outer membrane protein
MIGRSSIGMLILLVAGCAIESSHDRPYVAEGIEKRTGHGLGPAAKPGEFGLPVGVSLEDGLSDDEAVALALWNNAQFQADLIQATVCDRPSPFNL